MPDEPHAVLEDGFQPLVHQVRPFPLAEPEPAANGRSSQAIENIIQIGPHEPHLIPGCQFRRHVILSVFMRNEQKAISIATVHHDGMR